jgi:hypothetical protein
MFSEFLNQTKENHLSVFARVVIEKKPLCEKGNVANLLKLSDPEKSNASLAYYSGSTFAIKAPKCYI